MHDEKRMLDYHEPEPRRLPLWAEIILVILLLGVVALMVWPRNI
jgi:hypothetical protein